MMKKGCHVYILYVIVCVENCLREPCNATRLVQSFNWYLF